MAEKTLEQRLAALEKAHQEALERAEKAEKRNEGLKAELKQTRAAFSDHKAASARAMGALNSMEDLVEMRRNGSNPYDLGDDETPRERKLRIQKETVKTKDGNAHYYIEKPAHVAVNGGAPIYHEGDTVVALPNDEDHLPSITWLPVEVAGKDVKTGKLIFRPKGQVQEEAPAEPGDQIDDGAPKTNTQINEQRAKQQQQLATRGAGAPPAPPARPSDQTVG